MAANNQWWKKDEEDYGDWQELTTDDGLTYYFNRITQETTWDKPHELLSENEKMYQSSWVWVEDHDGDDCYLPAKKLGEDDDGIILELQNGTEIRVGKREKLIPLRQQSLQRVVADLTLLDEMSVPLILHCLRRRFEGAKIYTSIGGIIISLNPYTMIEGLYERRTIKQYQAKLEMHQKVEPHVFCPAHEAYNGLTFASGPNQSIIISGESGAGKTEAAKQCLSYIGAVSGSVAKIEKKIFKANPILEAFGNAKTVRNNNSSRFGKYIEIYMNSDLLICGAKTTNYLLEKVRVVTQQEEERNYHIFYFLTGGADRNLKQKLKLGRTDQYNMITMGGSTRVPGIQDKPNFDEVMDAFEELEFNSNEQMDILTICAAILHLGNVEFDSVKRANRDESCEISDMSPVRDAAKLLSVSEATLAKALRTQKIVNSFKELNPAGAADQRNSFCKFVYSKMFDWLVLKVNEAMPPIDKIHKSIGILDIFGFEIFTSNSLEQLCINYCNEKLQCLFNQTVFQKELAVYKSEQIQVDTVEYVDNQPIVDLIDRRKKPYGIIPLLDEEGKQIRSSQDKYVNNLMGTHQSHKNFKRGKDQGTFILTHYAGPVVYDTEMFLEKNKDKLSADLAQLASACKLSLMVKLFGKAKSMKSSKRKATLGKQFTDQLQTLMKELNQTQPHYIRCIKPNADKAALSFVPQMCLEQLTYAGCFEAVKIRKGGYPFRLKHNVFIERYQCILEEAGKRIPRGLNGCKAIIDHCKLNQNNVKMGRTMVLYRAQEHSTLELKSSIIMEQRKMAGTLIELLKQNRGNVPDRDLFFQKVAMVVKSCNRYNIHTRDAEEVRGLLEEYIAERMDPRTKELIEEALATRDLEILMEVCEIIEEEDYQTTKCQLCIRLRDRMFRVREVAMEAYQVLETEMMRACLQAAEEVGYEDEHTQEFTRLFRLGENSNSFIQEQIRRAAANKDVRRQMRLEVKLKDKLYENAVVRQQHAFKNFPGLKDPDDWASEKWALFKGNLNETMMLFTKEKIHTTLTEAVDKQGIKLGVENLSNIQCYCSDKQNTLQNAEEHGLKVLELGFSQPMFRDEVYSQIIKQTIQNPNEYSLSACWKLLDLCLCTFAPSDTLENYLEVYIRESTYPEKDVTLQTLRSTCYQRNDMREPPSLQTMRDITQGLRQRNNFLSEPPSQPTWVDLLEPFDDNRDGYDAPLPGFSAAPPKQTAFAKPRKATITRKLSHQPPATFQPPPSPFDVKKTKTASPKANKWNKNKWKNNDDNKVVGASPKKKNNFAAQISGRNNNNAGQNSKKKTFGLGAKQQQDDGPPPAPMPVKKQPKKFTPAKKKTVKKTPPKPPTPNVQIDDDEPYFAWVAHLDHDSQDLYYFNEDTNVTTWEQPGEPVKPFWVSRYDEDSKSYYYEELIDGSTSWEKPDEYTDENETWVAHYDKDSQEYYYENIDDQRQSWTQPKCFLLPDEGEAEAGEWERHYDPSTGQYYYENLQTGVTTWDKPADF